MESTLLLRRMKDRPLYRWAAITYIGIIAATTMALFLQAVTAPRLRPEQRMEALSAYHQRTVFRLESLKEEVEVLQDLLLGQTFDSARIEEMRSTIAEVEKLQGDPFHSVLDRLNEIEEITLEQGKELDDLKLTLNPTDPGQMLSVLRLGDKFELIGYKIEEIQRQSSQLRNDLNKDIEDSYRHSAEQIGTIKWILGLLLLLFAAPLATTLRNLLHFPKRSVAPDSMAKSNASPRSTDIAKDT